MIRFLDTINALSADVPLPTHVLGSDCSGAKSLSNLRSVQAGTCHKHLKTWQRCRVIHRMPKQTRRTRTQKGAQSRFGRYAPDIDPELGPKPHHSQSNPSSLRMCHPKPRLGLTSEMRPRCGACTAPFVTPGSPESPGTQRQTNRSARQKAFLGKRVSSLPPQPACVVHQDPCQKVLTFSWPSGRSATHVL